MKISLRKWEIVICSVFVLLARTWYQGVPNVFGKVTNVPDTSSASFLSMRRNIIDLETVVPGLKVKLYTRILYEYTDSTHHTSVMVIQSWSVHQIAKLGFG